MIEVCNQARQQELFLQVQTCPEFLFDIFIAVTASFRFSEVTELMRDEMPMKMCSIWIRVTQSREEAPEPADTDLCVSVWVCGLWCRGSWSDSSKGRGWLWLCSGCRDTRVALSAARSSPVSLPPSPVKGKSC